jgi:hypothetical protein
MISSVSSLPALLSACRPLGFAQAIRGAAFVHKQTNVAFSFFFCNTVKNFFFFRGVDKAGTATIRHFLKENPEFCRPFSCCDLTTALTVEK